MEQFIERYAVDVSQGGIFIRTKEPLAVGTQMKFEFQLRDASPLIGGEGTVVWTRENDPSRPAIAPGMGVRFDRLAEGSQGVLEKILAEKAKQAPQRGKTESTKPPLFTDTPTRVAPAPVQEALLGGPSGKHRTRADSQETPLPKPMPFHTDADEFGEEAFEEATKVRALDELVAQTAAGGADVAAPGPDAAAPAAATSPAAAAAAAAEAASDDVRRRDALAASDIDRDSAPGLPSPPESGHTGRTGKLLDTTPSPRTEGPGRSSSSSVPPANVSADGQRTRLGVEPAKAATDRAAAVAAEPGETAARRRSSAPIVIGILFTLAVAGAAVWYFVLREQVAENVANNATGSGSALATNPTGSDSGSATPGTGSNGSAVAMTGSNGSATEAAPTVETEIAANVAKATVSVVDSDQAGPAPFKAQFEKDKTYKVRVEAPGYLRVELDVKGGQDKVTAKLVAKPRLVSVTSDPSGALIYIDGSSTGKRTPADVQLSTAQAARKQIHVQFRLGGYRFTDRVVDLHAMQDDAEKMTASVAARLVVVPAVINNNNNGSNVSHVGSGSGSAVPEGAGSGATSGSGTGMTGSGTTGSGRHGSGTGSGTTSTPGAGSGSGMTHPGSAGTGSGVTHPGTGGTGSGTTHPGTGGTGSAGPSGTPSGSTSSESKPKGTGEPEPDWSKSSQNP